MFYTPTNMSSLEEIQVQTNLNSWNVFFVLFLFHL
jgi:hypothetical protein